MNPSKASIAIFSAEDHLELGARERSVSGARRQEKILKPSSLGGHGTVRNSLLVGLQRLGVPFRLNPALDEIKGEAVGLLAGKTYARQLLANGLKVLVGPNYTVSPRQDRKIFLHQNTAAIVPSEWVANFYREELPGLAGKIRVWSSGVDSHWWNSHDQGSRRDNALVYLKRAPTPVVEVVKTVLTDLRIPYRFISYGDYRPHEYRALLGKARFVVWIGSSESQCIAMFEAWSMGVPTFVFKSGRRALLRLSRFARKSVPANRWSAGPYVNPENGECWSTGPQLRDACLRFQNQRTSFAPRQWVLDHATLEKSALQYIQLLTSEE